ncbi:hypothetical protein T492DRAFT_1043343 [Pavlovales sp. CCMP2436]|nr:hypothetical protein T492DRAFT_1043343 [Pavlovales sp. CCMP2436]
MAATPQIWKIATAAEASKWEEHGLGAGSELDQADCFIHASDSTMVRNVAKMFFAGREDVVLLKLTLNSPPIVVQEEPDRSEAAGRATPTLHCLPDGCIHVFRPDQPTKWCAIRKYPLPLRAADGAHDFPTECASQSK